ncbi:2-amino-4-hydroxy-6-hydroxymethyldihydropteridine diphosphokinase [Aurantibacillus circumpalustris]|uniref:2-amino-4-hydroxy-6- hydroxymethyldihydropteridine diphosphokinase n=1 Tax=Aurantibacillus circumpalustris TaxID=3036359 RepID=UPI00295B6A07|nr:2-amino-4-hydroxy-6-hydroxymethyldihydropteridine diphosphokinase [Aurantibacillus circumpalustris]
MNVAFLGLGGNIGNRFENLRKTTQLLEEFCGKIEKYSSVYETDAWGSDSKNRYFNQVIELHTHLNVEILLEKTLRIEEKLGRNRHGDQNSDRTVDIDILFFNDSVINSEQLEIPHPRLHLRKFVLIPLCELSSALCHPVLKKNMKDLLNNCDDKLKVTKVSFRQNT